MFLLSCQMPIRCKIANSVRSKIHIFLTAIAMGALAQESVPTVPVLSNSGAPMRLNFVCQEEELAGAGMSCSDENPCPVYLELEGISSAGKKLLVAGNLHGPSATIYSMLLGTDDGGVTWKEATTSRSIGAAIDQVQLLDSMHGWAAGEVQVPLARDPFFLITTDGGVTWRRKLLTEDGGPGDMQRFWFDSADHGEVIVDGGRSAEGGRYVLYESHTAGDSWTVVSKTTQVPMLRRAPASENTDYRISTDNGSKAYVIEKRDGAKWSKVAAFFIHVANCGSPPPPPPPAPPENPPLPDAK